MQPTHIDHLTKAFSLSLSAARTSAHDLGIGTRFELQTFVSIHFFLALFSKLVHFSNTKIV